MSISKYPIDVGDSEGITEAVNYLLSGPAGLGQNFEGFSAYTPAYLRPSNQQPWSLPIDTTLDPSIYLSLPISDIQPVGGNPSSFLTVTFTTPLADAPFQFGDKVDIADVIETGSDETLNNTSFAVFSCTASEVVVGYNGDFESFTWNTYVSGGNIGRDYLNTNNETDCNAHVTVSGATQQVFLSAQINLAWEYTCTIDTTYNVKVRIYRLRGTPSTTPGSNEYSFGDDVLVTEKIHVRPVVAGSGTDVLESIFTTVLDGPGLDFNYYWYILEVYFDVTGPPYDVTVGRVTMGLRSLTAQVIKE